MWYPTLPDLLQLHNRICAVQDVPATVVRMDAVDEAILAPQREEQGPAGRAPETVATKCAAMLVPIVCKRPFEHCNDRVAYSIAQRFADRNGYVLGASIDDILPVFEHMQTEEAAHDAATSWIQSHLTTRFNSARRTRIFSALNALAEVKEELEAIAGLHEDVDEIDRVGFVIAQQMGTLFRLGDEERSDLRDRFPALWDAWEDALLSEK